MILRFDRAMLPIRSLLLVSTALAWSSPVLAQSPLTLPTVSVQSTAPHSLSQPTLDDARKAAEQVPGNVEVVSNQTWRDTAANTLKDVFDYTPGVFVQPKWGEDSRFSIRGSGLSRNFHMRGVQLLMDGIPFNNVDGGADFQEIDPTAFRYADVQKGANALRYGANSLGGAVNFISPTGYDSPLFEGRADLGSFGFRRLQAATGAAGNGVDGFLTGSWLKQDGYRDHSAGESFRASGNLGWQLRENIETRLFFAVADIEQEIPGSVSRASALNTPKQAAAGNLTQHYQRNMDSWRLGSKTTVKLDGTDIEFGGFAVNKHLIHPIYQYLDYTYHDFGGFARLANEHKLGEHANRVTAGVTVTGGWVDNSQFVNQAGAVRGNLLSKSEDRSFNVTLYAEDSFALSPGLNLIAGLQYVHAERKRSDELPAAPDTSGSKNYDFANPKLGLVWQAGQNWQIFGNLSRAGEAPTFSELNFTNARLADLKAQESTTLEIGTRGRTGDLSWSVAVYRAHLNNEFQFFDLGGGNYSVVNADKTIHQGFEAGVQWAFAKGLLANGPNPDQVWLNGAYTFSDFRFDGDPSWGDNKLPGAPQHSLRAELVYRHPAGFYVGPNVEWVPTAYYVDNANTTKTASYALLGLRAGYEVNEHVSFFVDGRNLTDERYIASASIAARATAQSALFEPGIGRAVFGGVKLRW